VRMGPKGELVIMHWDFAGPGSREWELAGTLFSWTSSGTDLRAASSLLAGYRGRRVEVPSLSLDSFSSVVTGALTWILHRGWEASAPEPSEQREYAERTLREVLADPLTVDRLDALVTAVE